MISISKSRNGLTAFGLSVLGVILVLLAFCTKSWLVTDGKLQFPQFERIGLWTVCFKEYQDPFNSSKTKFDGCQWAFKDEYYVTNDVKDFYYFVQSCFSVGVIFAVLGLNYSLFYMRENCFDECYVKILFKAATIFIAAGLFNTIALITFGYYGDSRLGMLYFQHNHLGWSYGVAVAGSIVLYICGVLYLLEARIHRIMHQKLIAVGEVTYVTMMQMA